MSNESLNFSKLFFQTLEETIENVPKETQEKLYHQCAVNCVNQYVLKEQQRQFEECNKNLDLQYKKYGKSEYFFADIIEAGHIYEIGYPRCLCSVVDEGFKCPKCHCECSRQSILYVLNTLMPEKQITVETMHTVLSGGNECRFRVTVES